MSEIIKPRETWFVTNQTNNVLIINDVPSLPKIKANERIDLLKYASMDAISGSVILSRYIGNKWLIAESYLHTHDDKSNVGHKHLLIDITDVTVSKDSLNEAGNFFNSTNITGQEAEILTNGSYADLLHKHNFSSYSDEIKSLFSQVAITGNHNDLINIGINSHLLIDSHISDSLIHFKQNDIIITESQISDLDKYNKDETYSKTEVDALLSGLGGDYLNRDGSNADTTINIGSQDFTTTGIITGNNFISGVAIGTSPYACTSTTLNSNLNADLLDGQHGTYYAVASGYVPYIGATTTVDLNYQNLTTSGLITAGGYSDMPNLGDMMYGGGGVAADTLSIISGKFLKSLTTPYWGDITESDITLSNNTINNVSITQHGFAPTLPNNNILFLNGEGNWATPSTGTANSYMLTTFTSVSSVNIVHNFAAYPVVSILEDTGSTKTTMVAYNIVHNSTNDFTVTFTSSKSGVIIASVGSPQPQNVIIVSGDYEILITDRIVQCESSGKIIMLPTAIGNTGREFIIDNSSNGEITVMVSDPSNMETIENEISQIIPSNSAMNIYSDGSEWRIY